MSKNIRVIPRLDIKGPNVVKPVQTEALRVVGDPKTMMRRYYKDGADEIIYSDVVASLYGRNLDLDQLKKVTEGIFIPVTAAGGIRTIGDINNVLRAGADKVAINTSAVSHPEFLKQAIKTFGAQCIIVSVDAKKQSQDFWEAYTDGGREKTGKNVIEWVKEAIGLGVGEILISSIDRDGTRQGYDTDLVEKLSSFSRVPIIAHGGAGNLESMYKVIADGKADAISASSVFHYNELKIKTVKKYLKSKGINTNI